MYGAVYKFSLWAFPGTGRSWRRRFPFYKAQPYELWTPKIDVCPESDITEH